jgi:hypothetical protein
MAQAGLAPRKAFRGSLCNGVVTTVALEVGRQGSSDGKLEGTSI